MNFAAFTFLDRAQPRGFIAALLVLCCLQCMRPIGAFATDEPKRALARVPGPAVATALSCPASQGAGFAGAAREGEHSLTHRVSVGATDPVLCPRRLGVGGAGFHFLYEAAPRGDTRECSNGPAKGVIAVGPEVRT